MRRKIHVPAAALLLAVFGSGGLFADNFTFEAGARNIQKGKSDVIAAQKKDLAISESSNTFSAGQFLALPDENKYGANLPFFSLSYRKDIGSLGLQFGLAYESFAGDYSYSASDIPGRSGSVTTLNITGGEWKQTERNRDMEIGLRVPVKEGMIYITPRIGSRLSQLDVKGDDSSLYQTTLLGMAVTSVTFQGVHMKGDATGNYVGMNLDWNLLKFLDLYASYTLLQGLNGNLDRQTGDNIAFGFTRIGSSGSASSTDLTIPFYWKSGYKIDGDIVDLGAKWKIGERFFIKTGYKRESLSVSYPGYGLYSHTIASGGGGTLTSTGFSEPISNALIYGQSQKRSWETFSLSVGANIDFGTTK